MTKTQIVTATRSLDAIADEFAVLSDTGALRMDQCRLAYEWVGASDGTAAGKKENAARKESFRLAVNGRLNSRHEGEMSKPAVAHLVDGWIYMLRANLTPSPEIAKAAHGLASQTFKEKEKNYVIPAIDAIVKGANPVETFNSFKEKLRADKKNAEKTVTPNDGSDVDEEITFDSIIAMLGIITAEFVESLDDAQKSTLTDALSAASAVVA